MIETDKEDERVELDPENLELVIVYDTEDEEGADDSDDDTVADLIAQQAARYTPPSLEGLLRPPMALASRGRSPQCYQRVRGPWVPVARRSARWRWWITGRSWLRSAHHRGAAVLLAAASGIGPCRWTVVRHGRCPGLLVVRGACAHGC